MRGFVKSSVALMTEVPYIVSYTGFATNVSRRYKALKIIDILGEHKEGEARLSLLDIGTGNGEIARYLADYYDVVSVDVIDQRTVHDGFRFVQLCGEELPFVDKSFDVIVSNHVIEHVRNADQHLSEIKRVLKDDGLAYLATPNRFWPWEVHNKIPLLHYLPSKTFNALLKRFGMHHEDIFPLTWWGLHRKAQRSFSVDIVSARICKWPVRYHMQCPPVVARILSLIPLRFYRMCTFIHPTLVMVLRKKKSFHLDKTSSKSSLY
jgi:SAM-dependent methyltransferase